MQQTPGHKGIWDGIQFTLESLETCDYVIVLNRVPRDITVKCPPQNIWAIMQEPPNEYFKPMHRGHVSYQRIYTQDVDLHGKRYIHSQPALPWHVNKDYDYLINRGVPSKDRSLSWVTSNLAVFQGHRARLRFLEKIHGQIEFDLFGRGFEHIEDKWDGLAPYRYSLVIENFRNPYYWSEKIADCFLAWTMPIYYGCTRITDYFPAEAVVCIDIDDPMAVEKIRETISSDVWRHNLDAIAKARELFLNHYQLFPFVARQIRDNESCGCHKSPRPQTITIPHQQLRRPDTSRTGMRHEVHKYGIRCIRQIRSMLKNLLR